MRKLFKNKYIATFILLLFIPVLAATHKFYVSLTEIHIVPEKGSIQISMRIFPDDLDQAINTIYGVNPQLATELEYKDADEWVAKYLKQHFELFINNEAVELTYIGKEAESGALWCYLEAKLPALHTEISVISTLLIDEFSDQKNIVQVYSGEFNKGLLLDANSTEGSLVLDKKSD